MGASAAQTSKEYLRHYPVPRILEEIRSLKARAVVIDMEEGVVNATLKGPLGELFDSRQFLADASAVQFTRHAATY